MWNSRQNADIVHVIEWNVVLGDGFIKLSEPNIECPNCHEATHRLQLQCFPKPGVTQWLNVMKFTVGSDISHIHMNER